MGNLNATIAADGSALDVGLTVFGAGGAAADMTSGAGHQPVTAPTDPGIATVLGSVNIGGVGQFQAFNVGSADTNYTAGLQAALTSVNPRPPRRRTWSASPTVGPTSVAGGSTPRSQLTGNGDALAYAVDGSGNESAAVSCLVPPPPQ